MYVTLSRGALPLLIIAAGSALCAPYLRDLPLSPVILAFGAAVAISALCPVPEIWRDDMVTMGRTAARWAIALMGLRLSA